MKGCGKKTYWEYPLIPKEDGCCGHFYCGIKYDCDDEPCYCQKCKDNFALVALSETKKDGGKDDK